MQNRKFIGSIFLVIVIGLGSMFWFVCYQKKSAIACDTSKPQAIDKNKIKLIMESALRGSPQDAFSLYRYYFQLADVENEKYWAMIAAENGHSIAQRNYGGLLLQYGNREEKLRGQFWLATAYRCGNDEPPTESHEK